MLDKSDYAGIFSSDEDEQQDLIQTNLMKADLVDGDRTDYNLPFDNETNKIKPTLDVVPKDESDFPTIDPTINVTTQNGDNDLVYVKYIPPPPDNPSQLIHPRDKYRKYRQKVKHLRKKKEDYRKRVKKIAIQTFIKKKNKAIRNTLLKSTKNEDGDLDIDFQITAPEQNDGGDDDVVYVKYIAPPLEKLIPLIHPREKYKQKVKPIRKRKEDYRKRAKKEQYKHCLKRGMQLERIHF